MLTFIHQILGFIKNIMKIPFQIKRILFLAKDQNSYYINELRKPYFKKVQDLFYWYIKWHEINEFYYIYGFDLKNKNRKIQDEFQDYENFRRTRNKSNLLGKSKSCQIVILRDKFLFYKFMVGYIPVPKVFAIYIDGQFYDYNMCEISIQSFVNKENYFVKDMDGECASFVKKIRNFEELEKMFEKICYGKYIFQEVVSQCDKMNMINPTSINTLRIVTVKNINSAEPYVLSSLLRVGTKATGSVDNWAVGGLIMGVYSNGYLKRQGFYKPGYGKMTMVHPDTGICFAEFQVPYYQDAIKLACQAHKLFYNVNSIGWDVAITDNGPIIIEGNDNWEISMLQVCDKGLRKKWQEVSKIE